MNGSCCEKCGAFGDMPHAWVEGDCVLPHRGHHDATIGHVCEWHVDRHKAWLGEIVELWDTLDEVMELGSVPDDTAEHKHIRKRPGSPALFRLDAWAMCHPHDLYATGQDMSSTGANYQRGLPDVPGVLAGWAQNCVDSQGMTFTARRDPGGSAALLQSNAEHVAAQPWVDEYDAELGWLRRSLRRAHGITDPQPLGRCITVTDGRECRGLVWHVSGGKPKCDRCSRRYGHLDLVRLRIHKDMEPA